jgi:propanol-preferring alcohol dehydrogenase
MIMKAAVLEQAKQPMVIKEVPDPSVGADDVLLKVRASGVCHTDLHVAEGFFAAFGLPFPIILGHEIAGEVEQVGANVKHLKRGDRVGAYWQFGCGHCHYCLSGKEQLCITHMISGGNPALGLTMPGGYAEYVTLGAEYAMPLPDAIDFTDAAPFFCAGLTMYGAFKNAGVRPGQRVAILGIGGLGHMAIPIAKAMGAEVTAITSHEAKQALAKQLGADHTISATGAEVGKNLLAMGGTDVILSTTLDNEAIKGSMQGLLPQGALVLTALSFDPLPIVPLPLLLTEQRIIGSVIGSRGDLQELLQLAAQNNIRPITECYSLDKANDAHDRLRAGNVRFRAVLTPN